MWALAAIILIFCRGVKCDNEECSRRLANGCSDWPRDFPRSAAELEASCRITRNNMYCSLDLHQSCNLDQHRIDYLFKAVDFLNKECSQQSWIFKAISRDIVCLNDAIPKVAVVCYENYISGMWKNSAKAQLKNQYNSSYEEDDIKTCLDGIWEDVCSSTVIHEECRLKTAKAVLAFLLKMDYKITACQDEIISKLSAIRESTALEESVQDSITLAMLLERDQNNV